MLISHRHRVRSSPCGSSCNADPDTLDCCDDRDISGGAAHTRCQKSRWSYCKPTEENSNIQRQAHNAVLSTMA